MAGIHQLRSLPKSCRDNRHQDRGNQDLGSEGEPEIPISRGTDSSPSCPADNSDQDRDKAPDGLHARHQDSGDEANNDSNEEAAYQPGDFHVTTQPLRHPVGQAWRAEKAHENTFSGIHPSALFR